MVNRGIQAAMLVAMPSGGVGQPRDVCDELLRILRARFDAAVRAGLPHAQLKPGKPKGAAEGSLRSRVGAARIASPTARSAGGTVGCLSVCFTPALEALEIQPVRTPAYPVIVTEEPALQRKPTRDLHAQVTCGICSENCSSDSRQNGCLQRSRTHVRGLPDLAKSLRPAAPSAMTPQHTSQLRSPQSGPPRRRSMSRTPRR